ncbi:MAG: biotin/lipoyl-containing protein, partial [Alphaproteobacteria bacterium]
MSTEIKVPELGESVTEATVGQWLKKAGDQVDRDEPLVELETDKVTLEVNAPHAGTLSSISAEEGAEVEVGAVLAMLEEGAGAAAQPAGEKAEQPAEAPAGKPAEKRTEKPAAETAESDTSKLSPAVRRLIDEHNLAPQQIPASGKDGRLTKGDVLAFIEGGSEKKAAPEAKAEAPAEPGETGPREERVRMTRLRRRVAERLKEAQNTAAMLTTFNEADMSELLAVRE